MSNVSFDIAPEEPEEDAESFFCADCEREFVGSEFEWVDAEFDPEGCRCPTCQFSHDLQGQSCDFCDEPAEHALGSTFYCTEHFDDL